MRNTFVVAELHQYPVKSAAGLALEQGELDGFGLRGDRRWMLVDAAGTFLSQRVVPHLALLRIQAVPQGLVVEGPGLPLLHVAVPCAAAPRVVVTIWRDTCKAVDAGAEAAQWLRACLGVDCRLVYFPDDAVRRVDPAYAHGDERVAFPDGFPLLLISQASLDELNRRLAACGEQPVPMNRFRPNLVVTGTAPHAEDTWRRIVIGEEDAAIPFDVVKPCARCATVLVDQATGVAGLEPLATLATYRRREGKIHFGQNLIHRALGTIRIGDPVRVVQ